MNNCFKYVQNPENHAVALRLFRAADGSACGDVTGPMSNDTYAEQCDVVELVRCQTLDDAFAAGIRMANKNDTDLVISGNSELWLSKWGVLEQPAILTLASVRR
ncbi:MAG: hypothetical protein JWQ22_1025 [Devosia sp.]|nr:hypothetical protein [Devosia sp.]